MQNTQIEIERNILEKYFKHLLSMHKLFKKVTIYRKLHPGGTFYSSQDKEFTSDLKLFRMETLMKYKDIKEFNIDAFCEGIYQITEQRINYMEKSMIDTFQDITKFTGNTFDCEGKAISVNVLLNMFEQMRPSFDKEGNYIFPEFIVHPKQQKMINDLLNTDEFRLKSSEIIKKQKEEYFAQKCFRKLSYINN